MPYFVGSGSIRAAQVNNAWWDRVGMEVAKRVGGQADTTQAEAGRIDIGTHRTHQGGRSQSRDEVVVEARNMHFGPVSIHERHEGAVARIAQAA